MRIVHFNRNVEATELENYQLKSSTVIIDGQNYFYQLYQRSGLPFEFGCEADKYAEYLRNHLVMFKDSNMKCYVIFKGGHEDRIVSLKIDRNIARNQGERSVQDGFNFEEDFVRPVFMKTVYKEVLRELGIDFVICKFESKGQCIALAQKLKCPIISYDIEFCFSGVPYIPQNTILYDNENKIITCKIFNYNTFKNKYDLTDEKVAIFIALTDLKIARFSEHTFSSLFRDIRLPFSPFKRNQLLIQWFSTSRREDLYRKIGTYLNEEMRKLFREEIRRIRCFICKVHNPEIPVEYLLSGKQVQFSENDPNWFEKGIALGKVAIKWINLCHHGHILGSWCIEDEDADDSLLLSFDIIAYAYNLITNYEKDEIVFYNKNGEVETRAVNFLFNHKPYSGEVSPFSNGWDGIKSLRLFEKFLEQAVSVQWEALESLPEDAKLLVLALVYFSRKKVDNMSRNVYSILMSYVMLSVVSDKTNSVSNNKKSANGQSILEHTTDKNVVTEADCYVAKAVMASYFTLNPQERCDIFDRKLIHPFVEFQHCLGALNDLNNLCGNVFSPTVIYKTYNGTFVYKLFYSMRNLCEDRVMSYLEDKLSTASSVLAFLKGLINVYEELRAI